MRRSQAFSRGGRRIAVFAAVVVCALAGHWGEARAALNIVPHKAAYVFEMVSADPSGGVTGVTGGMTFEWADVCDGWAVNQNYLMRIENADGSLTEIQTSNTTWESKDGLRYRFNIRRGRDGDLTEELRGDAHLDKIGGSGSVAFSKPREEEIALPAGTQFPTYFMLEQMRAASEGRQMGRILVFEGGGVEGPQAATTTILPRRGPRKSKVLSPPLGPNDFWPIHVAYYPVDNQDGAPETEISLDVQANGVVPRFVLDYGLFKLRAVLDRIAALPDPGC